MIDWRDTHRTIHRSLPTVVGVEGKHMPIAQTPGHIAHHIGTDDGGAVEVHDAPNEHVKWHRDNLIGHPVDIHVGGEAEVQLVPQETADGAFRI
jgi:hypothetical protein